MRTEVSAEQLVELIKKVIGSKLAQDNALAALEKKRIIAEAQARPLPSPESAYVDLSGCQTRMMTWGERIETLNGWGARRFGVWHKEKGDQRPTILARTKGELEEAVRRGAVRAA